MEYRWYHKLSGILFVVLCFEVGLFLVFFPWSDFWRPNLLGNLSPDWGMIWMNFYFRGAVSGLGLINIYISIAEAFRLRRFSQVETSPATINPATEAIEHND
jgi:hypothetical protein